MTTLNIGDLIIIQSNKMYDVGYLIKKEKEVITIKWLAKHHHVNMIYDEKDVLDCINDADNGWILYPVKKDLK